MSEIVKMPKLGLNMTEGTINEIFKKLGDSVAQDEVVLAIETDKATSEITAPCAGVILAICCEEGEEVPIGNPLFAVGAAGEEVSIGNIPDPAKEEKTIEAAPTVQQAIKKAGERVFISPLAKKMAEKLGIDYSGIIGSGPSGRIVKKDIEGYQAPSAKPSVQPAPTELSDEIEVRNRIPMKGIRSAISKKMSAANETVPAFHLTVCVDMSGVKELRRTIVERGIKIGYNEFLVKACSVAMEDNPMINATLSGDEIIQYRDTNIGVAVAARDGLVVPVIQHVERKSLAALAKESAQLFSNAREGKIAADNSKNGTFTISNLGMFSINEFDAIINLPESAILAVGEMTETPVVVNGEIVIRPIMKLTGTFDHRIIDGAVGAKFMKDIKTLLEDPMSILIN